MSMKNENEYENENPPPRNKNPWVLIVDVIQSYVDVACENRNRRATASICQTVRTGIPVYFGLWTEEIPALDCSSYFHVLFYFINMPPKVRTTLPIKRKLEIVAYAKQNGISAASREFDVDRQNIRLLTMIWKIFEYFRCCCVFQWIKNPPY